jgi:hypothetical protein
MLIRPGRVGRIGSTGRLVAVTPAPTPTSAWNPADKNAAALLSNSNKTATRDTGSGNANVRNTVSHMAGKWYAEFLIVGGNVAGSQVGIANSTQVLSIYLGSSNSAGYGSDGYTGVTNGFVDRSAPFSTANTVLAVSIDQSVSPQIVHFYKNGVCITGDPVAGTGGHTIAADAYFLIASLKEATASFTVRTGAADFTYSPPSGYTAWG